MINEKRIIAYQLNIKTFKDSSNNGIGDFNGFNEKLNYLKKLKIDLVFIDDILRNYENAENLDEINTKYGSLNDFLIAIKNYHENKINVCPIIDLSNLKQTYLNWKNMMHLYSDSFDTTKEIDWNSMYSKYIINNNINPNNNIVDLANFILYFDKIINFYNECGIKKFALENFEFLFNWHNKKNSNKFEKIEDLYKMIKRINPSSTIILKFNVYNKKTINQIMKNKNKCFDYLYLNYFSTIGINSEMPYKAKIGLDFKMFAKQYKKFIFNPQCILGLSSNFSGRINSMWGDERAYNYEAAKTFLLTLFGGKNSLSLYYGDELGMLRSLWIEANENKNKSNEEKRFYESLNISYETYKLAKQYHSPENANSLMSWDNSNNSGFSNVSKYNSSPALNYKNNNVESELDNSTSPLNFYLSLIKIFFNSELKEKLNKFKLRINFLRKFKLIKIKWKNSANSLLFLINLSSQTIKSKYVNNYKLLLSSYGNKIYTEVPKILNPFESLILIKSIE